MRVLCRGTLFGDFFGVKSNFSEVELRDYYQLAFGDNVVRIHDTKGTAVWWRRKWKWDKTDKTLQYLVLRAVRDLYHDLLTQHRDRRKAIEDNANLTGDEKKHEDEKIKLLIQKTTKSLSAYGNRRNKDVTDLIAPRRAIKFSTKCREKNRIYEQNNNADLDNGVYNEFVNEQEREEGALMNGTQEEGGKEDDIDSI